MDIPSSTIVSAQAEPATPRAEVQTCEAGSFPQTGPQRGAFRLSLRLPSTVTTGSPIPAALRLETTSPDAVTLLSDDNPYAVDYTFAVERADDGHKIDPRPDWVRIITRISRETVSASCPAYQGTHLDNQFALPPGRYLVRATRALSRLSAHGDRLTALLVDSNVAMLVVLPR